MYHQLKFGEIAEQNSYEIIKSLEFAVKQWRKMKQELSSYSSDKEIAGVLRESAKNGVDFYEQLIREREDLVLNLKAASKARVITDKDKEIKKCHDTLAECWEYFHKRADVDTSPDGLLEGNEEMILLRNIEGIIGELKNT